MTEGLRRGMNLLIRGTRKERKEGKEGKSKERKTETRKEYDTASDFVRGKLSERESMSIITVLSSLGVRTIMGIHGNVGVGWGGGGGCDVVRSLSDLVMTS